MIPGYLDFEFDLPGALLARLIEVLDGMRTATLEPQFLKNIPDAQGVYQLFLDDELVYIGKTDAEAGLRKRLARHHVKIQHRNGLDPNKVWFKAVRIYVFTAVDLETQLIDHYGGQAKVRWNGSGFGSNDPGRERDTTAYRDEHFDALYPIDIDRPIDLNLPASATAATILANLKSALPYVLRYQGATSRSRRTHPDLDATTVSVSALPEPTLRRVVEIVVKQLPAGWQATQLPSHVILYKEDKAYPHGTIIARSA
jgi:hypothetical protein